MFWQRLVVQSENNQRSHQGAVHEIIDIQSHPSMFMLIPFLLLPCSSIDLMLERLCLEGSRRQAKYAVHALAAITKDDGLKSLSVLYKVPFSSFCCVCLHYHQSLGMLCIYVNISMIFLSQFAETRGHAGGEDTFACCTTISGMHCTDCNASF